MTKATIQAYAWLDVGLRSTFICVAAKDGADTSGFKAPMQQAIKSELNPLFKLHDVVVIDKLPRTASNKVMHRELKAQYTRAKAA